MSDTKNTHPGSQDVPTGRLQRFVKLSALSGQVSASVLGQKMVGLFQREEARARGALENQIRNAERVVETMGHLKGAVMKIGQMMSLHDGDGVPQEVSSILSRLQNQAPTLPYARIREQFTASFDAPPEALFQSFSQEPMAAASLGQVHRGVLKDGTVVAVKVQYPGIAETVSSDLKNLRTMLDATGIVSRRFDTDGIFMEIRARLLEEVDYVQEAINLETFRRLYATDPRVVIPRYFPKFSSERILTMELIEGLTTQQMLESGLTRGERNALGMNLLDIFLRQLLVFGTVHADPHHGNYLFLSGGRVALLDFGCVKRFDRSFTDEYRNMGRAAVAGDRATMVQSLVELGFLADDKNTRANDLLCDVSLMFMAPFLQNQEFEFGAADLHLRGSDIPKRFLALGKMNFPPDALYLNRVFIGLYFLLRKLEARGNWHQLMLPYLQDPPRRSSDALA